MKSYLIKIYGLLSMSFMLTISGKAQICMQFHSEITKRQAIFLRLMAQTVVRNAN